MIPFKKVTVMRKWVLRDAGPSTLTRPSENVAGFEFRPLWLTSLSRFGSCVICFQNKDPGRASGPKPFQHLVNEKRGTFNNGILNVWGKKRTKESHEEAKLVWWRQDRLGWTVRAPGGMLGNSRIFI